ncbi:hypothetical protein GA0115255_101301, partial [Streptomyces sp. Ncost-T6T-2b]
ALARASRGSSPEATWPPWPRPPAGSSCWSRTPGAAPCAGNRPNRTARWCAAPTIPVAPGAGTLVGLETAADRVTYYWADPATGGVLAHRPGEWVIPLGGGPVDGRIAALRVALDGYDCTVLAHRTVEGDVMLAACATENEADGLWWAPTGERSAVPPALARDAYGRVVMATLGDEGGLRIAVQSGEPGLVMGPSLHV